MTTQFVQAPDGMKTAYDQQGTGPALVLIHGANMNRQAWHQAGYVDRLMPQFTVITLDLWGHGESDAPVTRDAYTAEKICGNVQAVVEACGFKTFSVWGFLLGGSIALQLAARSVSVHRAIGAGSFLGPIPETQRSMLEALLQAKGTNQLDKFPLTPAERSQLEHANLEASLAWLRATGEWPVISPSDLRCPTLLFGGSADGIVAGKLREQSALPHGASLEFQIFEGLDHMQSFSMIDVVFPIAEAFLRREIV